MERRVTVVCAIVMALGGSVGFAHEGRAELPEGPMYDRHELMERVGRNAKVIGDALKAGDFAPVAGAADAIKADAGQTLPLFPKGSTHPESRAKANIWTDWSEFEAQVNDLEAAAGALAETARTDGDVPAAAKKMFGTCKTCHDQFRKPEE